MFSGVAAPRSWPPLKVPLSPNVTILETMSLTLEPSEDIPHPNTDKEGWCLCRGNFVINQTFCKTLNRPSHSLYPWLLGNLPKLQTILNHEIDLEIMNGINLSPKCWQGSMMASQQTFDSCSLSKHSTWQLYTCPSSLGSQLRGLQVSGTMHFIHLSLPIHSEGLSWSAV